MSADLALIVAARSFFQSAAVPGKGSGINRVTGVAWYRYKGQLVRPMAVTLFITRIAEHATSAWGQSVAAQDAPQPGAFRNTSSNTQGVHRACSAHIPGSTTKEVGATLKDTGDENQGPKCGAPHACSNTITMQW